MTVTIHDAHLYLLPGTFSLHVHIQDASLPLVLVLLYAVPCICLAPLDVKGRHVGGNYVLAVVTISVRATTGGGLAGLLGIVSGRVAEQAVATKKQS